MSRAMSIAVGRAGFGPWIHTAKSWAASSTGRRGPPTSLLAATTGRPSISPAATIWGPSPGRSPASLGPPRRNNGPFRPWDANLFPPLSLLLDLSQCHQGSKLSQGEAFVGVIGDGVAFLYVSWEAADVWHEHARFARHVGADIPGATGGA